ncbi:hypothetical protein LTR08_004863 [Meristemomyces frigidus]|nr:hypothetical protein LTR08_004863 [Meristemomyces frigidus]
MDQGGLLQHQLPLHNEYALSSEHDFNDQFSGHAHHPSYASASSVDQLRRDAVLPQHVASSFFTPTNHHHGPRFVPDRGVASDASRYVSNVHWLICGLFPPLPGMAGQSATRLAFRAARMKGQGLRSCPAVAYFKAPGLRPDKTVAYQL